MMTNPDPRRNVDFVTINVRLRSGIKKAPMTAYYLQDASEVGLVVTARTRLCRIGTAAIPAGSPCGRGATSAGSTERCDCVVRALTVACTHWMATKPSAPTNFG